MKNAYFLTFHSSSYAQALKEFKSLAFLECEKGRSVHAGNICQGLFHHYRTVHLVVCNLPVKSTVTNLHWTYN